MKKLFKSLLKATAVVAALSIVIDGLLWAYYQFGNIALLAFMAVLFIVFYTALFYFLFPD